MAALQLRRGLKVNLAAAALTAAAGEPLIATDTHELYVGTGAGTVYKVSDVEFADVAPTVIDGKVWVNTSTNTIYRADAINDIWVATGPTISTDATLGGALASDTVIPSQKAIKAYVDNSTPTLSTDVALGGLSASDTVISSQKAIKSYVDANITAVKIPAEWPDSVAAIINTPPATPANGDRYIVGTTPDVGSAFEFIANAIVEWDAANTTWITKVPSIGTFISVDTYTTGLYYFGGSSWAQKSFELTTAGPGLKVTNGKIEIDPNMIAADSGLTWDATNGLLAVGILDGGTF